MRRAITAVLIGLGVVLLMVLAGAVVGIHIEVHR